MAAIYSPTQYGFDARMEAHDLCQVALLRELAGLEGGRLILKGGMAMRASFGSLRLTKDIDFDAQDSLSLDSLKRTLKSCLTRAAAVSRLRSPNVSITKEGATTRARLVANTTAGSEVRFEVEVSRRGMLRPSLTTSVIVTPPPEYGIAPFRAVTYSHDALCAMKISAALSANRFAARDLYDLNDLVNANADPTDILADQDPGLLREWKTDPLVKLSMLSYEHATQELLPYLPPSTRQQLTDDEWLNMTLKVAEKITGWCDEALTKQSKPCAATANCKT